MTQTTDPNGNAVVNGFSTNLPSGSLSSSNIPISSITPTTPITINPVPSQNPVYNNTVSTASADIAGGLASAQNQVNQANTEAENANTQGKSISNMLSGLESSNVKDTVGTYDAQGVNTLFNQMTDLNTQAQALNLQKDAIPINDQKNATGQGITDRGLAPITSSQLRDNALKALSLGQQYAIASGNYTKAKNYADQLIDTKYNQELAHINALKEQQNGLDKYTLTPAQAKRLQAQTVATNLQGKQLDQKIANEKTVTSSINDAIGKGLVNAQDGLKAINDIVQGKTDASTALYSLGVAPNSIQNLPKEQQTILDSNGFVKYNQQTQDLATQLVSGNLAPSEASKRSTGAVSYNNLLDAADKYSMATTGKHYNISQANIDYKFANNKQTQDTLNFLVSLTGDKSDGTTGNLNEVIAQSDARISAGKPPEFPPFGRTSTNSTVSFPPLNKVAQWAKLTSGDPQIAGYYATLTEVSDQIAKILQGGGSGGTSDAKLLQAQALFDKSFTPQQIKAVAESLKPLLTNRATSMVKGNVYLSDYADKLGVAPKSSQEETVRVTSPDGKTGTIPKSQLQEAQKQGYKPMSFNSVGSDTKQAMNIQIPQGTLASANNNPGNLRFVGQKGASEGKGGFAMFSSPQEGFNALINQIKLDASRGLTLAKFITKYAPPGENDTEQYIRQIAEATSTDPNTQLSHIDINKIAKAMAFKESSTKIL